MTSGFKRLISAVSNLRKFIRISSRSRTNLFDLFSADSIRQKHFMELHDSDASEKLYLGGKQVGARA